MYPIISDMLWDQRYFIIDGIKYTIDFKIKILKDHIYIVHNCLFCDDHHYKCTYPKHEPELSSPSKRSCLDDEDFPYNRCPLRRTYEPWKDGIGEELKN